MCTAITFQTQDTYFGRTLDLERTYDERVTITPRRFRFDFRHCETVRCHHAIIGMATVADGYPLYYEAANEKGLAMAGLNFPQNACYRPLIDGKDNVASFELIPWILSQCGCVGEARMLLAKLNVCDTAFRDDLPPSPLHWLIADSEEAIVVEPTAQGLMIYDNPIGVLTNNPPFDYHVTHLCDYQALSADAPVNRFGDIAMPPYSRGMGAMGLPGDWSSSSRFVRAAFAKQNAVCESDEAHSISQFFHILDTVSHPRGCVRLSDGQYHLTVYTSCINLQTGIYYYTTYDNRRISAVNMHRCNLDGKQLVCYPLTQTPDVLYGN